jgi:hypothetical protein
MSETIIDGTLLNTDNIKYSTPKANASGGKNVNIINKNTNSGLRISTPVMLTWGAKDFQDPVTGKGNGKFDMSLQFPSAEYKTEDTTLFLEKMEALEKKILTDALENSKAWFGKIIKSMDVLEALYTPFLKRTKDKFTGEPDLSKMPTLNVKLPIWEGVWKCEIYDSSTPLVTPIDYLQKGTNIGVLMQCGGIWFANGKFGVTWKLIQAMVQAPKPTLTGKCFYKLKPADKSKISSVQLTPASLVDEDTYVNDSEDDEAENVKEAQVLPDAVVKKAEAEVEVEEEPSVETSVFVTPVPEEIKKKKIIKKVSK